MSEQEHTLLVCTSCSSGKSNRNELPSGAQLHNKLLQLVQANPALAAHLAVESVQCFNTCKSGCAIALTCASKMNYVFGNLNPDSANDLLRLAEVYVNKDGVLGKSDRPQSLSNNKPLVVLPPSKAS
jgi:predicted metal-binding protein